MPSDAAWSMLQSLAGGLVIGLSAVALLALDGRIAGALAGDPRGA